MKINICQEGVQIKIKYKVTFIKLIATIIWTKFQRVFNMIQYELFFFSNGSIWVFQTPLLSVFI